MNIHQRLKKRYQYVGSINPRHISAFILGWMTTIMLIIIGWYEYRINDLRDEITIIKAMKDKSSIPYRDIPLDHNMHQPNTDVIIPRFDEQAGTLPQRFEKFFDTNDFSFPRPGLEPTITGTTQTFQQTRITPNGTISWTISLTPPTIRGTISLPSDTEAEAMNKKLIELGLRSEYNGNTVAFSGTIDDISNLRPVLGF